MRPRLVARLVSLALVGAVFAAALRALPEPGPAKAPGGLPGWDLPAHAAASLALVLVLTAAWGALGSHLSGLLAPFPIITSVLAVFTYAQLGGVETRVLLRRSFLWGFYGFAGFCFALACTLPGLPTTAAFALATGTALAIQAALLALRGRLRGSVALGAAPAHGERT